MAPGESVNMPVVFLVDPAIPERYSTLTLAYSLFEWSGEVAADQLSQREEARRERDCGRTCRDPGQAAHGASPLIAAATRSSA